ncbi:alpha/beta hydrolase [Abyssalbus ytuae]|uniref:Alpha/beta hydrolase n=1 Tax=Abyssalbus ytuae TaxID=2926907 RepID=A0A9E6ZYA8_9FLAO|nr:alpha/beta hydrolase [Abyssalbus ytuae]UOB17437.1 alpha/beta hydrolase [Abyssalbus ytuae]
MLTYLQEKLIFLSEELPREHQFNFNIYFEELFLEAADGSVLHGLHFKPDRIAKGIILYFHGNKNTVNHWGKWCEHLSTKYNYEVVVFDYRGYGKSRGVRSFKNMLSDGLLFYNYCKEHFDEDKIILFGRSLGGAFASYTARHTTPEKLILESTFTHIEKVAKTKFWGLPVGMLIKYPFQSEENIKHIAVETHIIHGTDDKLVKFELGEKLYNLSQSRNKRFYPVKGGLHNNLYDYPAYYEALDRIF